MEEFFGRGAMGGLCIDMKRSRIFIQFKNLACRSVPANHAPAMSFGKRNTQLDDSNVGRVEACANQQNFTSKWKKQSGVQTFKPAIPATGALRDKEKRDDYRPPIPKMASREILFSSRWTSR